MVWFLGSLKHQNIDVFFTTLLKIMFLMTSNWKTLFISNCGLYFEPWITLFCSKKSHWLPWTVICKIIKSSCRSELWDSVHVLMWLILEKQKIYWLFVTRSQEFMPRTQDAQDTISPGNTCQTVLFIRCNIFFPLWWMDTKNVKDFEVKLSGTER